MRTQNYRPKVHTGTLAKRRTVSSASISTNGSTNSKTTRSRNSRRRSAHGWSEGRGQGARVLWILMILGGLIGSGFVMAQHSQINVHQFKQAEEKVKTQLDEMTNQQRYLALEKERAINTRESERIAKQSGLLQPKLENAVAQRPDADPEAKLNSTAKASPALPAKTLAKPENKSAAKPAVKLASRSTAGSMARPTAKSSVTSTAKPSTKLIAMNKPPARQTPAKPVSRVTPVNKAIKDGKNGKNQQLAQKQEPKKDKRR